MSTDGSKKLTIVQGEDLHPAHVKRLIKVSNDYTRRVNASRITYPDPDTLNFDVDLLDYVVHPSGFLSRNNDDASSDNLRGKKNKDKGGKGDKDNRPKLPNPQTVLSEVRKYYSGRPLASANGNLMLGELNVEFGEGTKAKYFREAYVEILSHLHAMAVIEVDSSWVDAVVAYLREATGLNYHGYTSTANTRNQAVGLILHPRLQVVNGPIEYMEVATVQGVPDLRPAFRFDVRDTTTGITFSITVVHLKSMRGGPAATGAIRFKQLDILQRLLGPDYSGFIVGDLNYKIGDPTVTDGEALTRAGYELFKPEDRTGTHAMGSRLDGWFSKNLPRQFKIYQVRRFYANPAITRAFCDHAETEGQLIFCESQFQLGKSPNAGCSSDFVEPDVDVQPQEHIDFAPMPGEGRKKRK